MSAPQKPWEGTSTNLALSNAVPPESFIGPSTSYISSVPGTIPPQPMGAPPLPPRPQNTQMVNSFGGYGGMNGYGSYGGMGAMGGYGMSTMGGYGGGYGYGGYMGGMGGPYNAYNRYGTGPMDIESRFIQMAEENSRPAFESIGGVVQAVGSVAMMLDNTFLALTSSFRAILGVAENFGRLRSLFAQVWSSFAVLRSLNWLIRKLLVMLGIRTESEFKAWAAAVAETQNGACSTEQRKQGSGWPVLLFFGALAAAPYILLRFMRGVTNTLDERLNDPTTWVDPLRAVAQHDFVASSSQEISFRAEQVLTVAPQQLQGSLWNSGWLMASVDRQTAGLVPVNYIKIIRPTQVQAPTQSQTGPEKEAQPISSESVDMNKIYDEL